MCSARTNGDGIALATHSGGCGVDKRTIWWANVRLDTFQRIFLKVTARPSISSMVSQNVLSAFSLLVYGFSTCPAMLNDMCPRKIFKAINIMYRFEKAFLRMRNWDTCVRACMARRLITNDMQFFTISMMAEWHYRSPITPITKT